MTSHEITRFGLEIRRRRQLLGWTLDQFAEACSLTPNYLGTIEDGRRDVPISTLLSIARALECCAGDLFSDPKTDLSAGAREVGRLYDSAPPDAQEAVVDVLRAIDEGTKSESETDADVPRRARKTKLS